jgi:hypothetical protein
MVFSKNEKKEKEKEKKTAVSWLTCGRCFSCQRQAVDVWPLFHLPKRSS